MTKASLPLGASRHMPLLLLLLLVGARSAAARRGKCRHIATITTTTTATLSASSSLPSANALWAFPYQRPPLPLDPGLPSPDAFPFQLPQPFGSVPLARGDCCTYAHFPLPLPVLPKRPRMVFLLGAQKAGTTALYQLLTLHPQIATWRKKGVEPKTILDSLFFNKEAHFMGRPPTISHADVEAYLAGWDAAPDEALWLDATPGYLHLPVTACRIRAAFPDARLIISLRDPVLRAISQFQHEGRMSWNANTTQFPFPDRVEQELSLLSRMGCNFTGGNSSSSAQQQPSWNSCFKCFSSELCQPWGLLYHKRDELCDSCAPGARCDDLNWMVMKGLYAPIIANWLRFFPAEQIYVVNMVDQVAQLPNIFRFLGLPKLPLNSSVIRPVLDKIRRHSAEHFGANACALVADMQREPPARALSALYARHNAALYQLMNMMGLEFAPFKTTCGLSR